MFSTAKTFLKRNKNWFTSSYDGSLHNIFDHTFSFHGHYKLSSDNPKKNEDEGRKEDELL